MLANCAGHFFGGKAIAPPAPPAQPTLGNILLTHLNRVCGKPGTPEQLGTAGTNLFSQFGISRGFVQALECNKHKQVSNCYQ